MSMVAHLSPYGNGWTWRAKKCWWRTDLDGKGLWKNAGDGWFLYHDNFALPSSKSGAYRAIRRFFGI